LEKDLRAAIEGHAIQPYYQPIVDLKSRRIVGFESLARWRHPVSGFISPDTFIPLVEELGLMDLLSAQLFGDACREAATWPDDVSLSFNFSPSQVSDRNFADAVLAVMSSTGLPARRLEAEITESAIVTDMHVGVMRLVEAQLTTRPRHASVQRAPSTRPGLSPLSQSGCNRDNAALPAAFVSQIDELGTGP
jgi:EAL domain-containing protein (putative c-di-GMP-specific phosphodiesterase class I)